MSPVQSIPPTVTITSSPHIDAVATNYLNNNNNHHHHQYNNHIVYNNNNNNHINNNYKYIEATTTTPTATTTTNIRQRKVMSDALSISNITQKQRAYDLLPHTLASGINNNNNLDDAVSVEQSAVAAVAAAYQYNYNHLYADRAAVAAATAAMYGHGHPLMFTTLPSAHPSMFTVSTPVPAHAYKLNANAADNSNNSTVFSAAYLKAIQNAVTAGIFNPSQVPSSNANHVQTPTLPKSPSLLAASMSSLAVTCATSPSLPTAYSHNVTTSNGGTYLNAINAKTETSGDVNYFKVPCGKEGSLKHRILTRPQNVPQNLSTNTTSGATNGLDKNTNAVICTYDSTSNFRRGSYIELANGVLRKVEDMRTEDFIQCAERSPQHKLAESTVVKIDLTPANTVVITFSYDNNRSRADIEVSHDHPFFVYGQGWASFNPEASCKVFGLKCQRLQVGDICISLTRRETESLHKSASTTTNTNVITTSLAATHAPINMTMSANHASHEQNRYLMAGTDYASTNMLPLSPHTPPSNSHLSLPTHYAPNGLPYMLTPHLTTPLNGTHAHSYTSAEMADLVSAYAYHAHLASTAAQHQQQQQQQQPPPTSTTKIVNNHYYPSHMSYHSEKDKMNSGSGSGSSHEYYAAQHNFATDRNNYMAQQQAEHQAQQDEPVDASIRKRRWSAPDGVCDDDDDVESHRPHMRISSVSSANSGAAIGVNMYKIYKPSPVLAAAPPL